VLASVLERYGPIVKRWRWPCAPQSGISSDGEKATVLVQAADFRLMDDTARTNYFRATDSISSDGEHRRVLSAVLKKTPTRTFWSAACAPHPGLARMAKSAPY